MDGTETPQPGSARLKRPSEHRFWVYQPPKGPPLADLLAGPEGRARWFGYWVRDNIGNARDIALHYALRALPIDACSALGAWIGRTIMPRHFLLARARALATIARLRPDLSPEEQYAFYLRNCENQGRLMTEFSVIGRIGRRPGRLTWHRHEILLEQVARGPVILMGLHLGNWELGPGILKSLGVTAYTHYVPPVQRGRAWVANRVRSKAGAHFITPGLAGMKDTYGVLRRGGVLSILCDEGFQGTIRAPLFGRPPNIDCNMMMAAKLARATKAALCVWYVVRREGAWFDAYIHPPIELPPETKPGERIADDILLLNAEIEPIVRKHLDQWYFLDNALPPA